MSAGNANIVESPPMFQPKLVHKGTEEFSNREFRNGYECFKETVVIHPQNRDNEAVVLGKGQWDQRGVFMIVVAIAITMAGKY